MHHLVQAGHPGPPELPAQKVEVPDPGRGAEHQELQVPAVAAAAELPDGTVSMV